MKILFKSLFLLLFISSSLVTFSQSETNIQPKLKFKHSIGVQVNPYSDIDNISSDYIRTVYALRYGYRFDDFTFGVELFDWTYKYPSLKGNSLGFGIYSRFHFLQSKKTKAFVELNGYYVHGKTKYLASSPYPDGRTETVNNRFSYYVAPGISINLYKNRLSLDLMVKMSTERLQSGNHFDPSYKINFHF